MRSPEMAASGCCGDQAFPANETKRSNKVVRRVKAGETGLRRFPIDI